MKKKIINAAVILVIAGLAISGLLMIYGPFFAGHAVRKQEPARIRRCQGVDAEALRLDRRALHTARSCAGGPRLQTGGHRAEGPEGPRSIVTIVSGQSSDALAALRPEATDVKQQLLDAFHKDFGDSITDIYFSGYLVE